MLANLQGHSCDVGFLKSDGLNTLENIYQKYQKTVFDDQSFEEFLQPPHSIMTLLRSGQ